MSSSKVCEICGSIIHPQAYCCKRCKKLIDRVDIRKKPDKKARLQALTQAWDGQCFRCYYSGIRLVEDNPKDPRYLTFDHRTPGQESDVVLAAALINDMKSDMAEDEFVAMILQLSSHLSASGIGRGRGGKALSYSIINVCVNFNNITMFISPRMHITTNIKHEFL